jgi:sRNA-binding carbon storage regulator CsrA
MGLKIARKNGESIFVNDAKITVTLQAGRVVLDVECPQTTLVWRSSKSKEAKNEITLAESSTTSKNVQLQ